MNSTKRKMVDISFVILTWNSQTIIERCVKTFSESIEQAGLVGEFIFVDNGSQDKTVEIINNVVLPQLSTGCSGYIIELSSNMGTTKSRNLGLKKAIGRFCVVCDSDTEFLGGDWRQAMRFFDNNEQVGMIAGHLYYEDNTTQQSVKKFPTVIDKILKLRKAFLRMPESTTDYYEDFSWEQTQEVDTAISAFWMFRRGLLDEVGLFDERIYYAPEDIDFCLRVWQEGKKVIYYPEIKIRHKTQRLSHMKPLSHIALSHFFGLLYYFKKHKYWFSREKLYKRIKQ